MTSKHFDSWNFFLHEYKKLVAATGFLSLLPLPGSKRLLSEPEAETSPLIGAAYFPLVGLFLSALLWLLILVCAPHLPQLVLAALLVIALVILTGGLHLDGLMDSCDGLFGGFTRDRKLEIMRDSRVGSFGVLGGVCALLLKFACFAGLNAHTLPVIFLLILPSARWTMVLLLHLFPGARADGLGATFRQTVTPRTVALAGAFAIGIVLLSAQISGLFVWCTMTFVALLLGTWITKTLGGLTGDTYGAIAEIAEIVGLLMCIFLHFA